MNLQYCKCTIFNNTHFVANGQNWFLENKLIFKYIV